MTFSRQVEQIASNDLGNFGNVALNLLTTMFFFFPRASGQWSTSVQNGGK